MTMALPTPEIGPNKLGHNLRVQGGWAPTRYSMICGCIFIYYSVKLNVWIYMYLYVKCIYLLYTGWGLPCNPGYTIVFISWIYPNLSTMTTEDVAVSLQLFLGYLCLDCQSLPSAKLFSTALHQRRHHLEKLAAMAVWHYKVVPKTNYK